MNIFRSALLIGVIGAGAVRAFASSGIPIDLNGAYIAGANSTAAATTFDQGIGSWGQVQRPSQLSQETLIPFSSAKFPSVSRNIDLRGKTVSFTVDLGRPETWPNPSTLSDWYAGNAAEGHDGTSFVVRMMGTPTTGPLDLSTNNGLRIQFYRKDGQFWAGVKNPWYNEDFDIPRGAGATKYGVKVFFQSSGAFEVSISQLNGVGLGRMVKKSYVGGCTDSVGIAQATFVAGIINKSSAGIASPTTVKLSGFATDAVSNALVATVDNPYIRVGQNGSFRLWVKNLSDSLFEYQAIAQLVGNINFTGSQLTDQNLFANTYNGLGLNVFAISSPHQRVASSSHGISADFQVGTYTVQAPVEGSNASIKLLGSDSSIGAFIASSLGTFAPALVSSPWLVADSTAPAISGVTTTQAGSTRSDGSVGPGTVTLSAHIAESGSGLAGSPVLKIDIYGSGNWDYVIPMSSVDPSSNQFQGTFIIPNDTAGVQYEIDATDNSGNIGSYNNGELTINQGLVLNVTLKDASFSGSVRRILRIVLGGDGAPGDTHSPIEIGRIATFTRHGNSISATVVLSAADGVPVGGGGIKYLWVKDPYHTIATRVSLVLPLGKIAIPVTLVGGDLNNDNQIDIRDAALWKAKQGVVNPNTTTIGRLYMSLGLANANGDITADGAADAADYAIIAANAGIAGASLPKSYSPH